MNILTVVPEHEIPSNYVKNRIAVESVSDDGFIYTFATIIKNKHGRVNMNGIGRDGKFYAGSSSIAAVRKYAKSVDPNTTEKVFLLSRGRVQTLV